MINLGKLRLAFHYQKKMAKGRRIKFLLTFEQWLKIWTDSGHLHERGRGRGKYCMARFKDRGPYSVRNVRIILFTENSGEIEHSLETRKFLRKINLGKRATEAARKKMSMAQKGRRHSEATKAKMRAWHKGRAFSEEHKANLRKSKMFRNAGLAAVGALSLPL